MHIIKNTLRTNTKTPKQSHFNKIYNIRLSLDAKKLKKITTFAEKAKERDHECAFS